MQVFGGDGILWVTLVDFTGGSICGGSVAGGRRAVVFYFEFPALEHFPVVCVCDDQRDLLHLVGGNPF